MDGIGPRDNRPPRLEMAWGTVESNRFGTHEFLSYVEKVKSEPYVCCNLGTGTWNEAQQWVEYCNSSADTAMTRLRKQNGRAQPWNVKYWGLGNEMDGPWQMGHRSAADYGSLRARSRQADEMDRPEHHADRGRLIQLPAGGQLGGLESHRPGVSPRSRRLSRDPHLRGQPGQQLRRFHGELDGSPRTHQGHGRRYRWSASRADAAA